MTYEQLEASTVQLADWRVMIIEDNAAVAALHRRIVDSVPYLHTDHIARNGEHGFRALNVTKPDLVILDLTMAGGDGLSFLRRVRREGLAIDVIVVTASRGGRIVQEATHLGVIDYLVKPFAPERLLRALSGFAMRRRALTRSPDLSQADVDTVRVTGSAHRGRRLPKGIKESTLAAVVALLESHSAALSAGEVGDQVGVARVTARRYLEYLQLTGHVELVRRLQGPGRPPNRYRMREAR